MILSKNKSKIFKMNNFNLIVNIYYKWMHDCMRDDLLLVELCYGAHMAVNDHHMHISILGHQILH